MLDRFYSRTSCAQENNTSRCSWPLEAFLKDYSSNNSQILEKKTEICLSLKSSFRYEFNKKAVLKFASADA